jgi:hypothetical protein
MAKELTGKTNPIGVRFRRNVLARMKKSKHADGPQQALIYLEDMYIDREKMDDMSTNKPPSGKLVTIKEVAATKKGLDPSKDSKHVRESQYLRLRRANKSSKS